MNQEVELSSFDLRYEGHRMKNRNAEKRLLNSIVENGIRDPLLGVEEANGNRILLDGFKRFRCARTLGMSLAPYHSLGNDESSGLIELIRTSNRKSLTILEQAKLIDELKQVHKMSIGEIASDLEMSKAWVSLRAGMIKEMGDRIQQEIFKGKFPAYSYMYTLRSFMRINKIERREIEDFVSCVSGQGLSVRDIDRLAHGYFKGPDEFRQHIKEGNISWGLSRIKETDSPKGDCTRAEEKMLRDLEIVQKYMQRIIFQSRDNHLKGNNFLAQANLLTGGALSNIDNFKQALGALHDRSGQTPGNLSASSRRDRDKIDQPPVIGKPQNGQGHHRAKRSGPAMGAQG